MLIPKEEFRDKKNPDLESIFKCSFDYLVICICEEYFKKKNYLTIDEFNRSNKLGITKIITFPFFISISNGHSKSLFNLFGDFFTLSYGPVSLNIFNKIKLNQGRFEYFKIENDLSFINPGRLGEILNFTDIKQKIKESKVQYKGDDYSFDEIEIHSDTNLPKKIFEAIDSGIRAINMQSKGSFFIGEQEDIKHLSAFISSFKNAVKDNKVVALSLDEIKTTARPFYLPEPEILNV